MSEFVNKLFNDLFEKAKSKYKNSFCLESKTFINGYSATGCYYTSCTERQAYYLLKEADIFGKVVIGGIKLMIKEVNHPSDKYCYDLTFINIEQDKKWRTQSYYDEYQDTLDKIYETNLKVIADL